MTQQQSKVERFQEAVDRWFSNRVRECHECRDCGASVSPWDEVCPTCGRRSPAKVSSSAGIFLVGGFLVLLLVAAIGAWLF